MAGGAGEGASRAVDLSFITMQEYLRTKESEDVMDEDEVTPWLELMKQEEEEKRMMEV